MTVMNCHLRVQTCYQNIQNRRGCWSKAGPLTTAAWMRNQRQPSRKCCSKNSILELCFPDHYIIIPAVPQSNVVNPSKVLDPLPLSKEADPLLLASQGALKSGGYRNDYELFLKSSTSYGLGLVRVLPSSSTGGLKFVNIVHSLYMYF